MGHTAEPSQDHGTSAVGRRRRRLGRQDWIDAAEAMGGRVGFDHLAVEPLAAELGATKGSFYWHFADRAALLDAVLEHWETTATTAIIEAVEAVPVDERLAALVVAAFGDPDHDAVEWRLLAAASDPQIGRVVARVHSARIGYIERLLSASLSPARARARARVIYAAYLGHLQLAAATVDVRPPSSRSYLAELVALATAP